MALINLEQQVAVEDALKLAFIKLQQTGGFQSVDGVQTLDVMAYKQILDAIHSFDPAFNFGDEPTLPKTAHQLRDELYVLMRKYANTYGSHDSEPLYHYEQVAHAGKQGKRFPLEGENPWELFSTVEGWETASNELTNKAREYHQALIQGR